MARVSGDPGAVAGIFTYHDNEDQSDIQLLTRDPRSYVHYSNQPTTNDKGEEIKGSSFNESISSSGDYATWNVYRLDWFSGSSAWYVNGAKDTTTTVNIPSKKGMFVLNMWSNNGSWSGSMAKGDSAKMDVLWVEMAFNTSMQNTTTTVTNPVICSVEKVLGTPVISAGSATLNEKNLWASSLMIVAFIAVLA
jgi:hypothetical protein